MQIAQGAQKKACTQKGKRCTRSTLQEGDILETMPCTINTTPMFALDQQQRTKHVNARPVPAYHVDIRAKFDTPELEHTATALYPTTSHPRLVEYCVWILLNA